MRARLCWEVIWRYEDTDVGMRFDLLKHLKSAVNDAWRTHQREAPETKKRVGVGVSLRRLPGRNFCVTVTS